MKTKDSKLFDLCNNILGCFEKGVNNENKEDLQDMLNQFYAIIPYNQLTEGSYQAQLKMSLLSLGFKIVTQLHTSKVRIDIVINFDSIIYVIEIKLNKGGALKQIIDKQYAKKYEKSRKLITLIGIEICLTVGNISCKNHDYKNYN
jgi:hypothetical protein